jgi:hypothetical protein
LPWNEILEDRTVALVREGFAAGDFTVVGMGLRYHSASAGRSGAS